MRRTAAALDQAGSAINVFERLARDPKCTVEKLEKLIELKERVDLATAKAAYQRDFAAMQPRIPEIDERGRIVTENQGSRSYAKNEDIQKVLKPILAEFGFGLGFRSEFPGENRIRIIGALRHREGWAEESTFESLPDNSGKKQPIQMIASTIAYGHRLTTKDLCNITSRGEDVDGDRTAAATRQAAPSEGGQPRTYPKPDPTDNRPISEAQAKRLWVIARHCQRSDQEVKDFLFDVYKLTTSKKIRRGDYDPICTALESKGPLPKKIHTGEVLDREPGQEG
jgi:hypothetical protein